MNLKEIKEYYKLHPLTFIMLLGVIFRFLAAVFSKGYGWSDDHFLIIEIAQSWVDGLDYNSWLPNAEGTNEPPGFSFFYVGLHYVLFIIFEFFGVFDPQSKMLIIRLLHGLWSLLIIYYGYKITLKLSNVENAKIVGWLLSLFWMFPMLSVRNLVEYVCIPPIIYGLWVIINSDNKTKFVAWFWVGIVFGIAFNIRFQTALIFGSFGIVMLIQSKWKEAIYIALGGITSIVIFQGGIDYLVWDKPFIQLLQYVGYNSNQENIMQYTVGPWYVYILFISGILIPPVSLFIIYGLFKQWRKQLIIFLPVIIFIVFHSFYPNKQERFVVPIMPMLIIIGIIGWQQFITTTKISTLSKKIIRGSWIFFWVLNFIALVPITVMYSKQARVESMTYISKYGEINNFLIEDIHKTNSGFPPQFYVKNWYDFLKVRSDDDFKDLYSNQINARISDQPGFIFFYQPNNIEERVKKMKTIYPEIVFETLIEPGFMDQVLYWLNPINDNQNIYLYRNKAVIPTKINE